MTEYGIYNQQLTPEEFQILSQFIHESVGIRMPPEKKTMLEGRLRKRVRSLGFSTFRQYIDYIFSPHGMEEEIIHMFDVITTNKTDFFREPHHFDFLVNQGLPRLITAHGAGVRSCLMVWSAGCSTGEEAYSIAMVLSEFGKKHPGLTLDFRILATDISTKVLQIAQRAIYPEEKADPIPFELRKNYILKSKDRSRNLIRIVPYLREVVRFRRLNFLDDDFGFRERMDIIFFRNVLIYFDKPTQLAILRKVTEYLKTDGLLFIGHSENLLEMKLPLEVLHPTIYRRIH